MVWKGKGNHGTNWLFLKGNFLGFFWACRGPIDSTSTQHTKTACGGPFTAAYGPMRSSDASRHDIFQNKPFQGGIVQNSLFNWFSVFPPTLRKYAFLIHWRLNCLVYKKLTFYTKKLLISQRTTIIIRARNWKQFLFTKPTIMFLGIACSLPWQFLWVKPSHARIVFWFWTFPTLTLHHLKIVILMCGTSG